MPTDYEFLPARGRRPEGVEDDLRAAAEERGANLARRPDPLAPARMDALVRALADPDPGPLAAQIARLGREGVPTPVLIDDLVPAAARALGALWAEDRLSFATVTVGCARLQGLMHRAEPRAGPEPDGPGVVVAAVPGAQHTLGALVAAAQLRRARVSVRLALGTGPEIAATVRAARPALVALSAPAGIGLASLRTLSDSLRGAMGRSGTLALGGSLVTATEMTEDEREAITRAARADHVGADILEIAARCGLTGPVRRRAGTSALREPAT